MTAQEEREAKARILLEHAETEKAVELRRAEAFRISGTLQTASQMLRSNPDSLIFEGDSFPSELMRVQQVSANDLNVETIRALVLEIRELQEKLARLTEQKSRIGF